MALLIYNLVARSYFAGIWLAAFFNKKAKAWVVGRQGVFSKLASSFSGRGSAKVVWMHCASLGEFEQGRTVLEALKRQQPGLKILLTFFSPSGFEVRKNYEHADWVFYLPADTASNARRFVGIVRPDFAIFVKYEFWYHYLNELRASQSKVLLIAASFRPGQPFFRWYGGLHRRMLACFDRIFVQDEASRELLAQAGCTSVGLAGDPRVDRVLGIAQQDKRFPWAEKFCGDGPVLVCGSTWPEDEALIFAEMAAPGLAGWKIILAPHDVRPARLQQILKKADGPVLRCSEAGEVDGQVLQSARILLVDSIGMLAWLYRYGRVAYVGGGFGAGIHNTLEAVAFGAPVIFGPRYGKFREAVFLVENGGGFPVGDAAQLAQVLSRLEQPFFYEKAARAAGGYLRQNQGATQKITAYLLASGDLDPGTAGS